jgi:hypothetical protein
LQAPVDLEYQIDGDLVALADLFDAVDHGVDVPEHLS